VYGEVVTFEPFERQVRIAALQGAVRYIVNDAWVGNSCKNSDFPRKAGAILCLYTVEHFDGDRAAAATIASTKDGSHSPISDVLLNLKSAIAHRSGHKARGRPCRHGPALGIDPRPRHLPSLERYGYIATTTVVAVHAHGLVYHEETSEN
jgi:hypothetical protein